MPTTFAEKARSNRMAALDYVDMQKAKLTLLTGIACDSKPRMPVPNFGFSSSRSVTLVAEAA